MASSLRDETVGVVGIGNIGSPMARTLIRAGFDVCIYGRRKEVVDQLVATGGRAVASLEELGAQAHVVSVIVVNDAQVREVVEPLIETMKPGSCILVHSTIVPATVIELAELGAKRNISVLDATVSGGSEKAELGTLSLMVGGENDAVEHCWPIFEALGAKIFHVGPAGSGEAAKLVNQLISVGSYALQIEAMELADAYGIDEDTAASVVIAGQGDSRGMHMWGRNDRRRASRDPNSPHRVERDLEEAAKAGGLRGVLMPLTAAAAEMMPTKVQKRDKILASRPPRPAPKLCSICKSDLAPPFREIGAHPECLFEAAN